MGPELAGSTGQPSPGLQFESAGGIDVVIRGHQGGVSEKALSLVVTILESRFQNPSAALDRVSIAECGSVSHDKSTRTIDFIAGSEF